MSYSDSDFQESLLTQGQKFSVEYPDIIFITMLSNQDGPSGDFYIEYKHIKGDLHTEVLAEHSAAPVYLSKSIFFIIFFPCLDQNMGDGIN